MMRKNKKGGVFDNLTGMVLSIALFVIILAVTFIILANARIQIGNTEGIDATSTGTDSACYNSTACNSTINLTTATAEIPDWLPLIIITSIGLVLIGLVAMFKKR